ncbi:RND family efflux transporter MFP subunit [Xanthobacter flavus]|uniref:RND family efflux transporter MFP subunit n=2 Tax=Xanthobacter flavus TaxID=281 RepID=A0A9W6CJD1_XANFL|nr:efflux RND transporter periplasmic adaptor subunit [Xanthobacter flavus]MDR6332435.1 RND family efflux transporter MFP subunit [Xanthobacter flavus]GLI21814.1 RND transporter [Xanthobacter flavus]
MPAENAPGSAKSGGSAGRKMVLAVLFLALLGGGAWVWDKKPWLAASGQRAAPPPRVVAVLAGKAERTSLPVRVEALGTVESMVTVPVRSRVAAAVEKVGFADGATVKEGDLLYQLDPRVIDAQILQAEATLNRDKVQLEKNLRDVERYAGLATRNAVSQVQVDDARTTADVQKAVVAQDEANLTALRVQRGYYEIRSPATGRIGVSSVRPGTVIRVDDTLATVRQLAPIYVAFGLPERYIAGLRAAKDAKVSFTIQGTGETISGGTVAVIDNTIEPQTGTLTARAIFPNADERLWPGALGAVTVTLRIEDNVVAVPSEAVQNGQDGPFVFIVDDGIAHVRPVTVTRTVDGRSVIAKGLDGGETVVTDGQLSLREGSRVSVRTRTAVPATGS